MPDYLLVILLVGVFLAINLAVFCLEMRMVWPYGPVQDLPHVPDPTGYGAERVRQAIAEGFEFFGWAPDSKGSMYKLTYALLASAEGDCFCVIGIGKLVNHPMQGTWLHSPASDGRRSFYSTDNPAGIEIDVSGCWKTHLTPAKDFSTMLALHRQWVRDQGVVPLVLHPGREVEQFRTAREEHFRWLAQLGMIRFVDPEQTRWKYTLAGGFKLLLLAYSIGLMRALTLGRFPRTA